MRILTILRKIVELKITNEEIAQFLEEKMKILNVHLATHDDI